MSKITGFFPKPYVKVAFRLYRKKLRLVRLKLELKEINLSVVVKFLKNFKKMSLRVTKRNPFAKEITYKPL